jgi:hypothetical protein
MGCATIPVFKKLSISSKAFAGNGFDSTANMTTELNKAAVADDTDSFNTSRRDNDDDVDSTDMLVMDDLVGFGGVVRPWQTEGTVAMLL